MFFFILDECPTSVLVHQYGILVFSDNLSFIKLIALMETCFINVQDENERVILAYVAMRSANLALQYKESVASITPFPDNDEVLSAKVSGMFSLDESSITPRAKISFRCCYCSTQPYVLNIEGLENLVQLRFHFRNSEEVLLSTFRQMS